MVKAIGIDLGTTNSVAAFMPLEKKAEVVTADDNTPPERKLTRSPTLKRFKYTNLSVLEQPAPTLVLLSEFDGLEEAMIQSVLEESLEREPLLMSLSELLTEGVTACKEGCYPKAVKYLEDYCQGCPDHYTRDYIEAQMWLVKAYQASGQYSRAIALCQQMIAHANPQVQAWATKTLPLLSKEDSRV